MVVEEGRKGRKAGLGGGEGEDEDGGGWNKVCQQL
jgi:hypothetical protein